MIISSNTSSFLPVAEFLSRVDQRTVGDWASDTGVRIAPGSLPTDPNVAAAIGDACGEVESAALAGGRYAAADLATLAATNCVSRNRLYRIVSDIALVFLYERRPNVFAEAKPPQCWERASVWLEQLAQGTRIFSFQETEDAGRAANSDETLQDLITRNGVVTQAHRIFGVRSDRANAVRNGGGAWGGWFGWWE